jgi:hypothetical protein
MPKREREWSKNMIDRLNEREISGLNALLSPSTC